MENVIHFSIGIRHISRSNSEATRKFLLAQDRKQSDFFSCRPIKESRSCQLEGFQAEWMEMSEAGCLRRMEMEDGNMRFSFDLHQESALNWSGFVAKRLFGKTSKAHREGAVRFVEACRKAGYDSKAIYDISSDINTAKFFMANHEELEIIEDIPRGSAGRADGLLEINTAYDGEPVMGAVYAFRLGGDAGPSNLRRPLELLMNELKILNIKGLTNLAKKFFSKSDWRLEALTNKETTAFWAYYRIYKGKRSLRHTTLGQHAVERIEVLKNSGKLDKAKKNEIVAFIIKNRARLNKTDQNALWAATK